MIPHVAISMSRGDGRLTNERLWLWDPAFAGTTPVLDQSVDTSLAVGEKAP